MVSQSQELCPRYWTNELAMNLESKSIDIPERLLSSIETHRVKAASFINEHAFTEITDIAKLSQDIPDYPDYVGIVEASGRLCSLDGIDSSHWFKIASLSKDCQSCNVILTVTDTGLTLRASRRILPREPISMWFAENTLAMLNMPYLTQANFLVKNYYTCHLCNKMFESPNPLKIHLLLKCDHLTSRYLWWHLAKEVISMNTLSHSYPRPQGFLFGMTLPSLSSPVPIPLGKITPRIGALINSLNDTLSNRSSTPSNQMSPSLSNHASPAPPPARQLGLLSYDSSTSPWLQALPLLESELPSHHSAFRPYVSPHHFMAEVLPEPKEKPTSAACSPYQQPVELVAANPEQVESYYSNYAKVGNKFQCVYCGKLYSRKYGLKIHIRTHTGFKPLHCKICSREFSDPSNMNKHIRLHSGTDMPYKCRICNKMMVRKRDLERHLKSRHDVSPDTTSHNVIDVVND